MRELRVRVWAVGIATSGVLGVFVTTVGVASPASATSFLVNNGLAPPDPANVFGPGSTGPADDVWSRNVGCGTVLDPSAPCASPGAATAVELAGTPANAVFAWDSSSATIGAGSVIGSLHVRDSGTGALLGGSSTQVDVGDAGSFTLAGGSVAQLLLDGSGAFDMTGGSVASATGGVARVYVDGGVFTGFANLANISDFRMTAGRVESFLFLGSSHGVLLGGDFDGQLWFGASTGVVSGGTLAEGGSLVVSDAGDVDWRGGLVRDATTAAITTDLDLRTGALLRIVGSDFVVDGLPVAAGTILAGTGTLAFTSVSGTLASGEAFSALVRNDGSATLALVPEPAAAGCLSLGLGLAALAFRRRAAGSV